MQESLTPTRRQRPCPCYYYPELARQPKTLPHITLIRGTWERPGCEHPQVRVVQEASARNPAGWSACSVTTGDWGLPFSPLPGREEHLQQVCLLLSMAVTIPFSPQYTIDKSSPAFLWILYEVMISLLMEVFKQRRVNCMGGDDRDDLCIRSRMTPRDLYMPF